MGRRPERLGEAIREEVAQMVSYELKDPRVGLVTVTRVEVSPDLSHARVFVGVLGSEAERRKTLDALAHAAGFVRNELARRLGIRQVPEVDFRYDKGLDATERVVQLLEEDKEKARLTDGPDDEDEPVLSAMDGVLVVDKPAGPSSHDVVARARRELRVSRVGHTGTLDPFATGVLPLCIGKATRLARFLSGGEKVYRAGVRLGFATSTDDLTGEPLSAAADVVLRREVVAQALAGLVGTCEQVAPAFSAKHADGRRLYELARRGATTPRRVSRVTVHAIDLVSFADARLEIEVRCSPGTYVRALARDLGERLGVGAHLISLRRTRSGPFDLGQAVVAAEIGSAGDRLVPMAALLPEMPAVRVSEGARALLRNGRDLGSECATTGFPTEHVERVRLLDQDGQLLALAVPRGFEHDQTGLPREPVLHPDVVLLD